MARLSVSPVWHGSVRPLRGAGALPVMVREIRNEVQREAGRREERVRIAELNVQRTKC